MGEKLKLSPIIPSDYPKVSTSKGMQNLSQKTILTPQLPMHNLLGQPSKDGQIKEIDDLTSEKDFEDLQQNQQGTGGPSEPISVRRSERICLKQEKTIPTGPVIRSQVRKHTGEDTGILAYEINGDNLPKDSETIPSQGNDKINYNYLSISAEPIDKEQVGDAFPGQDC